MKFESCNFENKIMNLEILEDLLNKYHFTRGEHWDYERITFDLKMESDGNVYYLRIPCIRVDGDIGSNDANIKMLTPIIERHIFPHGLIDEAEENLKETLINKCYQTLSSISESL